MSKPDPVSSQGFIKKLQIAKQSALEKVGRGEESQPLSKRIGNQWDICNEHRDFATEIAKLLEKQVRDYQTISENSRFLKENFNGYARKMANRDSRSIVVQCLDQAAAFQQQIIEMNSQLAYQFNSVILNKLRYFIKEEFSFGKEKKKTFDKARLNYDAAIIKVRTLKTSKKIQQTKIEAVEKERDQCYQLFLQTGNEAVESLEEINKSVELQLIEDFDVFFATYREYFQKGWTYLSKLDSIMLEWKETARQSKFYLSELRKERMLDSRPLQGYLFGIPLETILRREKAPIPKFFTDCVEWLRKHALDFEGIFRISGDKSQLETLKLALDQGDQLQLDKYDLSPPTAHLLSGLLKYWLRNMPEPLFTFHYYRDFIDVLSIPDDLTKLLKIQTVISSLPKSNRQLLHYLFSFCAEIVKHSETNMMSPTNLGTVLSPTMLYPQESDVQALTMVEDMAKASAVVAYIISHFPQLAASFNVQDENSNENASDLEISGEKVPELSETNVPENETKLPEHETKLPEHETKLPENEIKLSENETKLTDSTNKTLNSTTKVTAEQPAPRLQSSWISSKPRQDIKPMIKKEILSPPKKEVPEPNHEALEEELEENEEEFEKPKGEELKTSVGVKSESPQKAQPPEQKSQGESPSQSQTNPQVTEKILNKTVKQELKLTTEQGNKFFLLPVNQVYQIIDFSYQFFIASQINDRNKMGSGIASLVLAIRELENASQTLSNPEISSILKEIRSSFYTVLNSVKSLSSTSNDPIEFTQECKEFVLKLENLLILLHKSKEAAYIKELEDLTKETASIISTILRSAFSGSFETLDNSYNQFRSQCETFCDFIKETPFNLGFLLPASLNELKSRCDLVKNNCGILIELVKQMIPLTDPEAIEDQKNSISTTTKVIVNAIKDTHRIIKESNTTNARPSISEHFNKASLQLKTVFQTFAKDGTFDSGLLAQVTILLSLMDRFITNSYSHTEQIVALQKISNSVTNIHSILTSKLSEINPLRMKELGPLLSITQFLSLKVKLNVISLILAINLTEISGGQALYHLSVLFYKSYLIIQKASKTEELED